METSQHDHSLEVKTRSKSISKSTRSPDDATNASIYGKRINPLGEKVLKRNETKAQAKIFGRAFNKVLEINENQTAFQKASISGRLEIVKEAGFLSEKRIEDLHFWQAD